MLILTLRIPQNPLKIKISKNDIFSAEYFLSQEHDVTRLVAKC